jgi:putative NADH-flavin reductase
MEKDGGAMKVVLIGASGMIGSRILKELVSRGHNVVAVVRDSSRVSAEPGVTVALGDVNNAVELSDVMRGADAVVDAYGPGEGNAGKVIDATRSILAAVRQAGVRRVIIVGGAASLFVAPGVTLLDSGHLPEQWLAIAKAHSDLLKLIRTTDLAADLDWTYLSPAAFIQPGERTGKFRLGKDDLLVDEQGQSRISAEDYAIALVDELERPQYVRERFTVGY